MDAAILVTGASSGIGAAIAADLGGRGFTVGCLSRRGTAPAGSGFVGLTADVRDEQSVADAIGQFTTGASPLVGIVNAAGMHIATPTTQLETGELRLIMETNFYSAVAVCRQAYPYLVQAPHGALIVNIGSFYEGLGVGANVAYAASKAALGSLTRCLAVEWAREDIRVLDVAPGYVHTGLNDELMSDPDQRARIERRIPLKRLGRSEEIGRFVGTLFAEPVGFLTGSTVYIDGGHRLTI